MDGNRRLDGRGYWGIALTAMLLAVLLSPFVLLPKDPDDAGAYATHSVPPGPVEAERPFSATAALPPVAVAAAGDAPATFPPRPHGDLCDAIAIQEGWTGGPGPSRDGEYGLYQITYRWWVDACLAAGVDPFAEGWTWPEVAFDAHRVEYLMYCYWRFYGADSDDMRARMHKGGGPEGWRYLQTLDYSARVLALMREARK